MCQLLFLAVWKTQSVLLPKQWACKQEGKWSWLLFLQRSTLKSSTTKLRVTCSAHPVLYSSYTEDLAPHSATILQCLNLTLPMFSILRGRARLYKMHFSWAAFVILCRWRRGAPAEAVEEGGEASTTPPYSMYSYSWNKSGRKWTGIDSHSKSHQRKSHSNKGNANSHNLVCGFTLFHFFRCLRGRNVGSSWSKSYVPLMLFSHQNRNYKRKRLRTSEPSKQSKKTGSKRYWSDICVQ